MNAPRVNSRTLLQLAFWLMITLAFLYDRRYLSEKAGLDHFAACVAIRVGLLMALAALHGKYLVPRLFIRRNYTVYAASVLAGVTLYCLLQGLYDRYLFGFVIGDPKFHSLGYAISYNFFTAVWYLALTVAFQMSILWFGQQKRLQELEIRLNTLPGNGSKVESLVTLRSGTKTYRVPADAMLYAEGLRDYSAIYLSDGRKIVVKGSLKTVEDLFPDVRLLRVHKSYLVAADKIEYRERSRVVLCNQVQVPVGRGYALSSRG